VFSANYGLLLFEARRYDEAVAFLTPLAQANPKFNHARSMLARALMATGDLAGARRELEARDEPEVFQAEVGVLYAKLGRRADALQEIERLEAMGREGFGVGYDEALIYAALGDLDKGCEALGRAVTDHSGLVNWMRLEPWLDPLRGRQCFADAEKKLYR
jgi:tetratricopeptide (TPR) repeat protein